MRILSLIIISTLVFSCNKDKFKNIEIDKELSLHTVKRAYYDDNDNRYYSDRFSAEHDGFNFLINVVSGTKYRIRAYGLAMWEIKLQLVNSDDEIIFEGEQGDPTFYSRYITFTADATEALHIRLINTSEDDYVYENDYFLSFEEIGTYTLNWKGHEWICDGDWVITDDYELCHAGHKSGFTKWARIADESYTNFESTIYFKGPESHPSNYVGSIMNADTEIREVHNLPTMGNQFKIQAPNKYEYWQLNNDGSVWRYLADSESAILPGLNKMHCEITADSIYIQINDILVHSAKKSFSGVGAFYLSVEDVETEPTFFTDIAIE